MEVLSVQNQFQGQLGVIRSDKVKGKSIIFYPKKKKKERRNRLYLVVTLF